jgi:hypothetical protein
LVRRVPRLAVAAAIAASLVGCSSEDHRSGADGDEARYLTTCQHRAAELGKWLQDLRMDGFDPGYAPPAGVQLVVAPTGERSTAAGAFGVTRTGDLVVPEHEPEQVRVAIDVGTPWSQVVTLLDQLSSRSREIDLLFYERPRARIPTTSIFDTEVAHLLGFSPLERTDRARGKHWENRIYANCGPARELFVRDITLRRVFLDRIIERLPKAVAVCGCRVDDAAVRVHLAALAGRLGAPVVVSLSVIIGGEDAVVIEAEADEPWVAAYRPLALHAFGPEHRRPVTLRVKPTPEPQ